MPSTKKRSGTTHSNNDKEESPPKKTCIRCSEAPDVTIIVGGKIFQEYRTSLRCWSSFFDRAMSSGMKEERSLKFNLPGREPKEWEWVVSLMTSMPAERVTMDKLSIALDWFDFLSSDSGLRECDKILSQHLPAPPPRFDEMTREALTQVMEHFATTIKYNLTASKKLCLYFLQEALVRHVHFFTKDELRAIASLVKEEPECRNGLWASLTSHLPDSVTENQAELLLHNDLLHEMISLRADAIRVIKDHETFKKETEQVKDEHKKAVYDRLFPCC